MSMQLYQNRLNSFEKYPVKTQDPRIFANEGFFYSQVDDLVICVGCNTSLWLWKDKEDIAVQHAVFSKTCPFVLFNYGEEFVEKVHQLNNDKDEPKLISLQRVLNLMNVTREKMISAHIKK